MTNWSVPTRLAFRTAFLYALLVWVPLTLYTLTGTGWWNPVATAVGRWGIVDVLGLPERSAPHGGLSTLLAPIVASVVFAVVVEAGDAGSTHLALRRIEESAFPLNSHTYHWMW